MNYGRCPTCGGAGKARERRPNGDTICVNGHKHSSASFHNLAQSARQQRINAKQNILNAIHDADEHGSQIVTIEVGTLRWILATYLKD